MEVSLKENLGWFDDVTQGGIGNCYLVATMSTIAIYPSLIEKLFLTKEMNKAGIYFIQYYIRGKPWVITVDDQILFNDEKTKPEHLEYNPKHPALWGALLEKAWSKLDANFLNSEAGFTFQTMRAMLGCPVAYYFIDSMSLGSTDLWKVIKSQMILYKYIFIASTTIDGKETDDTTLNHCGMTNTHAYPILDVFPLYNQFNVFKVDALMYMMRDPRGSNAITEPNTRWHARDYARWTEHYKK